MDTGKQIIQKVSRHSSSLGCPIDGNASCFWYAMNDKRDYCIVKTTNWPCETDACLLTVAFEVTTQWIQIATKNKTLSISLLVFTKYTGST